MSRFWDAHCARIDVDKFRGRDPYLSAPETPVRSVNVVAEGASRVSSAPGGGRQLRGGDGEGR